MKHKIQNRGHSGLESRGCKNDFKESKFRINKRPLRLELKPSNRFWSIVPFPLDTLHQHSNTISVVGLGPLELELLKELVLGVSSEVQETTV